MLPYHIIVFWGEVLLSPLQKYQLEQFCREHGLDTQLIDDSLTYEENKKFLESLLTIDEAFDDRLAKSMMEWYKSRDLGELYGISEDILESSEIPLLIFRFYVKYPRRLKGVIKVRISEHTKHVEFFDGYIIIKGQIKEIYEVINILPPYLRIVGRDMKYNPDWQFISGRWVRCPS